MSASLNKMCLKLVLLVAVLCASLQTLSGRRSGRIIGGTKSVNIEFPWLVSIVRYGFHWCGGAILNSRTILTAAHCIYDSNAVEFRVRIGSKHKYSGGQVFTVEGGAVHLKYNSSTQDYDIGLLRLGWNIQFSSKVRPILIIDEGTHIPVNSEATVAGWGRTEDGKAKFLRHAVVKIVRWEVCKVAYAHYAYTDRMFCAGHVDSNIDICKGDSGGPLVINGTYVVGIVSFQATPACGHPNQMGTYTKVSKMKPWVRTYLAEYGERLK